MTDYCTNWPDSIDGHSFSDCCEEHDKAYALGGVARKLKADMALAKCVWRRAEGNTYMRWNAVKMYAGVSTFGWWFWLKCRVER